MQPVRVLPHLVRVLPHSIESEAALIGSILINPGNIPKIREIVGPEDFYREAHLNIMQVLYSLSQDDQHIDLISLSQQLLKKNLLEKSGGDDYLSQLVEAVSTSAGWEYHAKEVKELSTRRQIIDKCVSMTEACYEQFVESEQVLQELDSFLSYQNNKKIHSDFLPMSGVIISSFKEIEKAAETEGYITGLKTGFHELDELTAGLQPADLIILAARPSMGKTALALNIASNVALDEKPVAVFSLEMSYTQLGIRAIGSDSRLDARKLRSGILRDNDWKKVTESSNKLSNLPIYIDETSAITVSQMKYKCKKLHKEKGLSLIIIDYLQLMNGKGDNRDREISDITRGLKALAKEFNVPVLCLSQLNRKLEESPNKRPRMAHLRESGAIEQDADVVAFIYRDEVYHPTTDENRNIAEIIIAKQRTGPIGFFKLTFLKEFTRFEDYADELSEESYYWQDN